MVKVKNTKIPRKRLTKQEQLGQNMSRLKSDFVDIERMLHFIHVGYSDHPATHIGAQVHNKRKKNTQKPKSTVKKDEKMIPKPAGSAGRDYNLQAAMGLSRNKKVYNAILVCANCFLYAHVPIHILQEDIRSDCRRYLDVTKRIKQQNVLVLYNFIQKVRRRSCLWQSFTKVRYRKY